MECKPGDIIVVENFNNETGMRISRHSFVVISVDKDYIEGLNYDFVANMFCSFHNEEHRRKKLKFKENLLVERKLIRGKKLNNKEGYIKADQFYYFNKKLTHYHVIAHMCRDLLDDLFALNFELKNEGKLKDITTNLR